MSGSYAYATAYFPGAATAVDVSNPLSPFVAGETGTSSTTLENDSGIYITGGYAYVVSKNRNAMHGRATMTTAPATR